MNIEPYIMSKSNGLSWYNYLRIHGGVGHGNDMGGKYRFVIAYLSPAMDEQIGEISLDIACKKLNIPFGGGKTIEEAYANFQEALKLNPIK